MHKTGLWMAGCGALLAVACTEVTEKYRYISLEQVAGIHVDRMAKLELDGLHGNAAIPVEYSLARERYMLHFSISGKSYHPAIRVAASATRDAGAAALSLHAQRDMHVRAPNGTPCASVYPAGDTFDFGWSSDCSDEKLPKAIEFDVLDEAGVAIGRESILFTLGESGAYSAIDSI
jgi:hypothetical protein